MLSSIIFILFFILLVNYVHFILQIYRGLKHLDKTECADKKKSVSVIIPFRNESENIIKSLQSLRSQDYPVEHYEVIYVDDNSGDDSAIKLFSAIKENNIRIIRSDNTGNYRAFKKRAVAFAIDEAKGEIILTTDADCIHTTKWISTMVSLFETDTAMVAGPVEFTSSSGLFSKIQRLEFRGLILAGAGLIGSGRPVTCSAANLAYRKDVFYEVNGFNDNLNLSSGDDELLMQKISSTGKYKISFCSDSHALVTTLYNKTINDFFSQRTRWASKGIFYNDKTLVARLVLIFLFYLSIPVTLVTSFFIPVCLLLFTAALGGKLITEYLVIKKGEKLIFKTSLLRYFFMAEIFQVVYIIIASIGGIAGNFTWKGRVVKR
jgi:cellulose synthase/poly-beta-1,6-N-acetylglucosamine synthase-like glycosyltransferase